MKKSLFILALSFFTFNLFGQDSTKSTSYYSYHALNIGVGVGWLNNKLVKEPKPLYLIGYDYGRRYFMKNRRTRLHTQVGLRFTNISSKNSFLDEELYFISIPVSIVLTKQYYSILRFNFLAGGNISVFTNNINVETDYFVNYHIGSGFTILERFELDFRYNFFVSGLEYIDLSNETVPFTNNNFIMSFKYLFDYKKKVKQPYW